METENNPQEAKEEEAKEGGAKEGLLKITKTIKEARKVAKQAGFDTMVKICISFLVSDFLSNPPL